MLPFIGSLISSPKNLLLIGAGIVLVVLFIRIKWLQSDVKSLEADVKKWEADYSQLETDYKKLQEAFQVIEKELKTKDDTISGFKKKIEELKKVNNSQVDFWKKRYEMERDSKNKSVSKEDIKDEVISDEYSKKVIDLINDNIFTN